ncbi:hypothetical protein AB1N83_003470 [Pleurotus pulmonarius]
MPLVVDIPQVRPREKFSRPQVRCCSKIAVRRKYIMGLSTRSKGRPEPPSTRRQPSLAHPFIFPSDPPAYNVNYASTLEVEDILRSDIRIYSGAIHIEITGVERSIDKIVVTKLSKKRATVCDNDTLGTPD